MDALTTWIQHLDPRLGYLVLALAATIEYLFPPFPGDTVVVLGAVLIEVANWSMPAVLVAATLGSVLGAALNVEVGRWLGQSDRDTWLHRRLRSEAVASKLDRIRANFERYGSAYVAINRFLPGVRSFIFIAAGMSGLPRGPVLAWAACSACMWNIGLIALGHAVGYNFDQLMGWVKRYTTFAWMVLGAVLLIAVLRAIIRRRSQDEP
ncbi:MAG: DedA family protein [Myxococcota bacterium]